MKPNYIEECQLDAISFHPTNYLQLSEIHVCAKCEIIVLEQSVPDNEISSFKICCLNFYIQLCKELRSRFKFNDLVLNFAKNLDPKIVMASPESIIPIYLRFKSTFQSLDFEKLSTEWRSTASQDILLKHVDKPVEEF